MHHLRLLAATTVAALAFAARPAQAQSATIAVSADVAPAITLTTLSPLNFSLVIPGLAKQVLPTGGTNGATAGLVQLSGVRDALVRLSFSFPDAGSLVSGANTLPIAYAGCHAQANTPGTCTTFAPAALTDTRLSNPAAGNGELFVWLGGTVTPAAAQVAGTYATTVTMNVSYVGY